MKVVVAGATGAIGRVLVRQLRETGHEVVGLTRRSGQAEVLARAGAQAVVCDVLDQNRLSQAVAAARPDVMVNELTSLPQRLNPRKLAEYYQANNRVRREGTAALIAAARATGVRRIVSQSAAFWYEPGGTPVKDETAPLWTNATEPIGEAVRTMAHVERMVRDSGLEAVNLRYGILYGPGTWYSREGDIDRRLKSWTYPIVGDGSAVTSFVHIEDAAAATLAAIESSATGTFNIVDDEPAPAREWMPALANAVGAWKPLRVAEWLARMMVGPALVEAMARVRSSSFVFPGTKPDKPLSTMALEMVMRRANVDATVHGFRSAFRDWAGERTAFAREISEAALAHLVGDEVERAYRRGDALEKRRGLMDAWASFLHQPGSSEVVPFKRARALTP